MSLVALVLSVVYLVAVFGVRSVVQSRAGGTSGWVRSVGANSAERTANGLFLGSCALDLAGPALAALGVLGLWAPLDGLAAKGIGISLFLFAIPAALAAQRAMGDSWRTGVDPDSPDRLVTDGPFATVRNPVYTTMLAASLGTALLAPTALAPLAVAGRLIGLEIQTRRVEEPFLQARHGGAYARYARRVGRFIPGAGRLSLDAHD